MRGGRESGRRQAQAAGGGIGQVDAGVGQQPEQGLDLGSVGQGSQHQAGADVALADGLPETAEDRHVVGQDALHGATLDYDDIADLELD